MSERVGTEQAKALRDGARNTPELGLITRQMLAADLLDAREQLSDLRAKLAAARADAIEECINAVRLCVRGTKVEVIGAIRALKEGEK